MRIRSPIVQVNESEHRWREEVSRSLNELNNPQTFRYTATSTLQPRSQLILASGASGAITLNLPSAASSRGCEFRFKCINATNPITISASDLIDGAGTKSLTTLYQSMRIISDGSTFYIV